MSPDGGEFTDVLGDKLRTALADAIRGALIDVVAGVAEEGPGLSPDEELLIEQYRESPEGHRQAAHRFLQRGLPPKES